MATARLLRMASKLLGKRQRDHACLKSNHQFDQESKQRGKQRGSPQKKSSEQFFIHLAVAVALVVRCALESVKERKIAGGSTGCRAIGVINTLFI